MKPEEYPVGNEAFMSLNDPLSSYRCNEHDGVPQSSWTESDPHGRDLHELGAKLDADKIKPRLVVLSFARALKEVAEVGTYGAAKYTDGGWAFVPDGIDRYTDAMLRHLLAESTGEVYDPATGLIHAAQTAWNALARLELMLRD